FWEFDPVKAYVAFDFSKDANLAPKTEVLSINGRSVRAIYEELLPYFPSDGSILSNKHSRLQVGVDFQFWYYLLLERPDHFLVVLLDENGQQYTKKYEAVSFRQWTKNYKKYAQQKDLTARAYAKYYVKREQTNRKSPIRYEYLADSIALLTILNFDDENRFNTVIPQAFHDFQKKQVENLIIDLRYNGGGSDILGRELFTYLIERPSPYFDSLYSNAQVADTVFLFEHTNKNAEWYRQTLPLVDQLPDGRFATKPTINEGLKIQEPKAASFKGKVYILMNGRSASTTAEFLAAAHRQQLATFIGEESGGAYHGGNGGDFVQLYLPNSRLQVQIPLSKYVMNSSVVKYRGQGTLPDFKIRPTMDAFYNFTDPELEQALELIRQNTKQ
ncbi:MAG: S41 family peptidase, partial [Bacteroidota bacterium]